MGYGKSKYDQKRFISQFKKIASSSKTKKEIRRKTGMSIQAVNRMLALLEIEFSSIKSKREWTEPSYKFLLNFQTRIYTKSDGKMRVEMWEVSKLEDGKRKVKQVHPPEILKLNEELKTHKMTNEQVREKLLEIRNVYNSKRTPHIIENKIDSLNMIFEGRLEAPKSAVLKDWLYQTGLKTPCCEKCQIKDWQGERIVFHLDHIDGNHYNNNLENLRILCPNCHSQTPTFGNKKRV